MRICLITLAKDEDKHVKEFLNHYFNVVGIDHVFWIDNNTSPLKPIIIDDERVTVIRRNDVNMLDGKKHPQEYQNDLINDVIKNCVYGQYDWCLYVDVDELLELSGNCNIHNYVKYLPKDVDYTPIHWVVHGNNYYVYDSELPYTTMRANFGWDENWIECDEYKPLFKVYENSEINMFHSRENHAHEKDKFVIGFNKCLIDWGTKLHHYRLQTIESYIKHKINNGWYKYHGENKRVDWIKGIFNSSQFYDSNPKLSHTQYNDVIKLLDDNGIQLSREDDEYLSKLCMNNLKVCALTIARNEDEHVEEYLNHYFDEIGVDHVFWIDNNTSPLKPVTITDERVTVIRKNNESWDDGKKDPLDHQNEMLTSVLREHVYGNYDWCIYADVDELLDLNKENIHDYITKLPANVDFVPVRWVLHSNNYYIYDTELPYKTMKENYGWDTNFIEWKEYKALFKVHKDSYIDIHFPYNERVVHRFIGNHTCIYFDDNIRIHHYRLQSLEHYIRHKVVNGMYGFTNKPRYVTGLFDSGQFKCAYPKFKCNQYNDVMKLLKKYNIDLSERDDRYLKKSFNVK